VDLLRDSTPERQRRRYGDMEYDWEYRGQYDEWERRLERASAWSVSLTHQPTDAALFKEMMRVCD